MTVKHKVILMMFLTFFSTQIVYAAVQVKSADNGDKTTITVTVTDEGIFNEVDVQNVVKCIRDSTKKNN